MTYTTDFDILNAVAAGGGNTDQLNVTVASSGLPAGAATSAKQDTGNTSLSSIDTKLASDTVSGSGAITGTQSITISCVGINSVTVDITGTWSGPPGAPTLVFEQTVDGSTWEPLTGQDIILFNGQLANSATANGLFKFDVSGIKQMRVRASSISTTANIAYYGSKGQGTISNVLNTVFVSGTVAVSTSGLPTGAATEASLAKLPLAQASTTASQSGPLVQGATTTSAPTYTTAKTNPLSLTTTGNLRVTLEGTAANSTAVKVDGTGGAFPATQSGTWSTRTQDGSGNAITSTSSALDINIKSGAIPTGSNVIGQVTANAGTNLNTSALALDTSVSGLSLAQASTTASQKGILQQGAVTTNAPSYTTAQTSPISLDTSGLLRVSLKDTPANTNALKVDGSAVTQPVSGTFWQATQPVSGTVTANIGTAGTLALDASVTGLQVAQASTTASQKGDLVMGACTTAAPSYTTAQTDPLSLNTAGGLRTALTHVGGGTQAVAVNNGTASAGAVRVCVASDNTAFTVNAAQSGTWTVQPGNTANTTAWLVAPTDGTKTSYSAAALGIVPATSATDIFTITGTASKTVRVTRLGISATQTTAGEIDVQLIKRSAANTSGTSASVTAVPHDSNDASATATVLSYSVNPSLGAAVAAVRVSKLFAPAAATAAMPGLIEYDFGNTPAKAIVLRGVAQVLAVNLNATTVVGGNFDCYVEWTEE